MRSNASPLSRASTRTTSPSREPSLEQLERERVLDEPLDRALQRPRPERGIPALLGEELLRLVGDLELDAPLGKPLAQARELQLDDVRELLLRQRLERHDLVDAVQELRPEPVAQLVRRADVRRHDDHGVAEVDRAALAVGQPPVVEKLQEDVEDLGVRLLDLVEEDDRVRATTHGFRELAAFLVPDVARRRANEARDRVPLLVLRHVEAHHRALVVEHELGERAGELGLPDAGRPEEDERADRAVRILEARAGSPQRVRHGLDRLVLADDALVQPLLHVDELLDLALEQARDRDPRPRGDDGGDVVLVDLLLDHRHLGALLALGELLLELGEDPVLDLGDAREVPGALLALGLHPQLVDLPLDVTRRAAATPSRATSALRARRAPPSRRRARARPAP